MEHGSGSTQLPASQTKTEELLERAGVSGKYLGCLVASTVTERARAGLVNGGLSVCLSLCGWSWCLVPGLASTATEHVRRKKKKKRGQ